MGLDYRAVAIIGIEFEVPKRLITYNTFYSCECPEREGQRFCPNCGMKVAAVDQADYSKVWQARETIEENLPKRYEIIDKDNTDSFVLGYGTSIDRHDGDLHETMPVPDLADVVAKIRDILEEAGIADAMPQDAPVKLHCMMDIR